MRKVIKTLHTMKFQTNSQIYLIKSFENVNKINSHIKNSIILF